MAESSISPTPDTSLESLDEKTLRSPDADDVSWWFRFSESVVGGIQACDPSRTEGETLLAPLPREKPTTKICRFCSISTDASLESCPSCHRRSFCWPSPKPLGLMAVKASRRGYSRSATEKRDFQLCMAPKERRIRDGLAKLSVPQYRTLQLWAESRQHGPEIWHALGRAGDLAMCLPRLQSAYAKYASSNGSHSYEVWLTAVCRDKEKNHAMLSKARTEAETEAACAMRAYQAVRSPPTESERTRLPRPAVRSYGCPEPTPDQPPKPKIKRRSVLERVRAMVMAKLRAAGAKLSG